MSILYISLFEILIYLGVSFPNTVNADDSDIRVNQYISFIQSYCDNGYSEDDFQFLLSQCTDPSILVDNDIPGVQKNLDELILYLRMLKKYNVQIEYNRDFSITNCKTNNGYKWGCFLKKKIIMNGSPQNYEEFVELVAVDNTFKISSIQSNLFPASVNGINCSEESISSTDSQVSEAEEKLEQGDVEDALVQYLESRPFSKIKSPKLEKKLQIVNLDSIFQNKFNQANEFLSSGKYEEALSMYESILRSFTTISGAFKENVQKMIKQCKDQLSFTSTLQFANLYFSQSDFKNALMEYNKCLLIRPSDTSVKEKISICYNKINDAYNRDAQVDIKKGENLILTNEKNNIRQGFAILMKYVHSGKLNGTQFFLMAQIVDTNRNKYIVKDLNITDGKACVLARHFMLEAKSLGGYVQSDFKTIWDGHFNNHSRSCE